MFLFANCLVSSLSHLSSLVITLEWPKGVKVLSQTRAHIIGYLERPNLLLSWLKAKRFSMDLTVCPSVWYRMSKLWQKRLGNGYISRSTKLAHETFRQLQSLHKDIKDAQQILFNIYGYKLRIKTLQKWIMQERYRRRPTDVHYWSVNW